MTISEASAVNTLLHRLLSGIEGPDDVATEEAAVYLADRSHKALGAGWDGPRVTRAVESGVLR